MFVKLNKKAGLKMIIGKYSFEIRRDKRRNILVLRVRYQLEEAVNIPLLDIFLQSENILLGECKTHES